MVQIHFFRPVFFIYLSGMLVPPDCPIVHCFDISFAKSQTTDSRRNRCNNIFRQKRFQLLRNCLDWDHHSQEQSALDSLFLLEKVKITSQVKNVKI